MHHRKWLRFSNGNTLQGSDLKCFCAFYGLCQLLRESTRQDYLLDLVLTDISPCSISVLPSIADHKSVLTKLPVPEVLETTIKREVWILAKADWKSLTKDLLAYDWKNLDDGSAEDSLTLFLQVVWLHLVKHIPRKAVEIKKSTHPWLNDRSKAAIERKNAAEGTANYASESAKFMQILNEERASYVQRVKTKLASLPRQSKQWWNLNRELMRRKAAVSSIPALRDGTQWLTDAKLKANVFARTFESKSQLPPERVDTPFFGIPEMEFGNFIAFRSRVTRRLFKKLDVNKATGADQISAAILKRLSDCLAIPFTEIVRRLFYEGCWPDIWKYHLIVPIFKRGPAFQPGNYRGVHLTTILSKVAEKIIGLPLVPFLRSTAFGKNQWAFTAGIGSRDLVTMLMMSWILGVCLDKKIGVYLSDISGAFDRV